MGFDTVLTQFATKNAAKRRLPQGPSCSQVHGSGLESVEQLCRGVAQPGSAPALGAGGRRFKSYRPDQLLLSFQFTAPDADSLDCVS
jgi:hypothetical protein